jgi:hypothetical protein
MKKILFEVIGFVFKGSIIKILVLLAMLSLVEFLVPVVLSMIDAYLDPQYIDSFVSALPPGVWFFLDLAAIEYGLPLVIFSYGTRFLIRRIPFIG